jgi:hypothetical protein
MKNKVSFYTQNVFVGPAPATGLNFLDASGNITSGPIHLYPDWEIGRTFNNVNRLTASSGLSIAGESNVFSYQNIRDTNGARSYMPVFPRPIRESGLYYSSAKFYIPSSNPQIKSLLFRKDNGGWTNFITGLDTWIKSENTSYWGVINGTAAWDGFGFSLASGTQTSNNSFFSFLCTGDDIVYVKDMMAINLSGQTYYNLLNQVNRVQSVDYSIDYNRQDIQSVGEQGLVETKPLNWPIVNLNISTLLNGLENEYNFGMDVNFPCFFSGFNGNSFKQTHYDITSGFNNRIPYSGISDLVYYPFKYTNKKNIYISIAENEQENNKWNSNTFSGASMAFGNCYLNSYSVNAQVNSSPTTNYEFICDNLEINDSIIGQNPGLNPKNLKKPASGYYILPYASGSSFPSVLNPGDITVTVSNLNYGGSTLIRDIGYLQSDWKVQGFNLDMNFEREPFTSIGYQLPIDRRVKYPIFANLGIDLIVGENQESHFRNLFYYDYPYDITISMLNKCQFNGIDSYKNIMALYSFKGAKLTNVTSRLDVNNFQRVSLGFRQEINPYKEIGLNMSGVVFGRNFIETGARSLTYMQPTKFVHISGAKTFINSSL